MTQINPENKQLCWVWIDCDPEPELGRYIEESCATGGAIFELRWARFVRLNRVTRWEPADEEELKRRYPLKWGLIQKGHDDAAD